MASRRVNEEQWVGTTAAVLQEVGERFVENSNLLRILGWDEKNRVKMSEGSRDEGRIDAEYSRDLQWIKGQDHCTQYPPKIREYRGVLDIRERLNQNLGVQGIDSRSSFICGVSWRGNDELETFIGFVMFRFDEPNQSGRKDEESR